MREVWTGVASFGVVSRLDPWSLGPLDLQTFTLGLLGSVFLLRRPLGTVFVTAFDFEAPQNLLH